MKKIKSVPSFVRQQLKVKGRTEHNGRGVYEMGFDVGFEVLRERLVKRVKEWRKKGLISSTKSVKNTDRTEMSVILKKKVVKEPCYRTIWIGKQRGSQPLLGVLFTW